MKFSLFSKNYVFVPIDPYNLNFAFQRIDWLTEKEKIRLYSYENNFKFNQYLITKIALRIILRSVTNLLPQQILFYKNNYGKLYLDNSNSKNFYFNISHTINYSIIVWHQNEIGVDIERVNKNIEYSKLTKAIFSKKELLHMEKINNLNEKINYFYITWTIKEAFLKYIGTGLINNLEQVCTIDIANNNSLIIKRIIFQGTISHYIYKSQQN